MLKFIATTILCILIHPLWAQEVSNVQVEQNGEELMVTFDLNGTEKEYQVIIEMAEDAVNFRPLGEMGIRPGKNEFRKVLKEPVFYASGVFRVSANKTNILTDIDGNKYKTIKIGTQIWMKENLKVSKYRNGDPIPTNLSDTAWYAATTGAYANSENNADYGKLYNWYAVADSRKLCPVGWHVPSDAEWISLDNYLGSSSAAGGKPKSTSSFWSFLNNGATKEFVLEYGDHPGNNYHHNGMLEYIRHYGGWWSSTETSITHTWSYERNLNYSFGVSARVERDKQNGLSVRCIKD
jgi:uncharacterized protein (TIGR02145 family)